MINHTSRYAERHADLDIHNLLEKRRGLAISFPEREGIDAVYNHLQLADGDPFRASRQGWRETLKVDVADGTAITAAAEALMTADFPFAANTIQPGTALTYNLMGRLSSAVTTPGTFTLRLRWGGLAGVLVAASGAFAPDPTAAATNLTVSVQWYVVCRTTGTAGTGIGFARIWWSDFDDATVATIVGNLNMVHAPTSAPATFTMDTTTGQALSPTYQPSLSTASYTNHFALLESIN